MKRSPTLCLTFFLLLLTSHPAAAAEPAPLLPENLAARAEMASNQKTVSVFLKEEDPEKATAALNKSNEDYGKKGWNVLNILTYNNDSDFRGFFVTYQKSLVID